MKKFSFLVAILVAAASSHTHAQAVISAPVAEVIGKQQAKKQVGMTVEHGINKGLQGVSKVQSTAIRKAVQQVQELHKTWYKALEMISNGVRTYRRVEEIFTLQRQMITRSRQELAYLRSSKLSFDQLSRCSSTFTGILNENIALLGQLQTLLQPSKTKMTDAQRLKFIDKVAESLQKQAAVMDYFSVKARTLVAQDAQIRRDEASLQAMLGK